jgi:hypothetical protein
VRSILRRMHARPLTHCLSRDFLLFMPHDKASLRTIYSYYLSTVNVNPEGDVNLSNELNLQGLGTTFEFPFIVSRDPFHAVVETIDVTAEYSYAILNGPWIPGLGIVAAVGHMWFPSLDSSESLDAWSLPGARAVC